MTANLEGVRFDQIYSDNSGTDNGQQPFDTDGDGTATQEDEFVSFTNTTGGPMDISGWQIWSDSAGTGAPDAPQDGLYHTFPPGTVLQPDETLYIINEITGAPPDWAQEASEGGVESAAGGDSTNLLSEGTASNAAESIALVNPDTGEYIVFNMSPNPPEVQNLPGFPGTTNVGTVDGHSAMADQWAGNSYRYNANSDSYESRAVSVPCFVAGTLIATPNGEVPVDMLKVGDLVLTKDNGPQPIRWAGCRYLTHVDLTRTRQQPIEFKPGSLSAGKPRRNLRVSPQHRILVVGDLLVPARGLTDLRNVRVMRGCRRVSYHHILLPKHEVIYAEGVPTESLLAGPVYLAGCQISDRLAIMRLTEPSNTPAHPCLTVAQARRLVQRRHEVHMA